jgi:hypothetical protein
MKKKMVALLAGAMLMMGTSAMALTLTVSDGIHAAVTFDSLTNGVTAGVNTTPIIGYVYNDFIFNNLSAFTQYGSNEVYQDQAVTTVLYNGTTAANLTITVTDKSYSINTPAKSPNTIATLNTHVNKISGNSTASFSAYFDNTNALGLAPSSTLIGTIGPLTSADKDDELVAYINTVNPFSLTEVIDIAFSAGPGSLVSLDSTITVAPVPEPGTMMLVGLGMLGMAVYGKRRQNKEA